MRLFINGGADVATLELSLNNFVEGLKEPEILVLCRKIDILLAA